MTHGATDTGQLHHPAVHGRGDVEPAARAMLEAAVRARADAEQVHAVHGATGVREQRGGQGNRQRRARAKAELDRALPRLRDLECARIERDLQRRRLR